MCREINPILFIIDPPSPPWASLNVLFAVFDHSSFRIGCTSGRAHCRFDCCPLSLLLLFYVGHATPALLLCRACWSFAVGSSSWLEFADSSNKQISSWKSCLFIQTSSLFANRIQVVVVFNSGVLSGRLTEWSCQDHNRTITRILLGRTADDGNDFQYLLLFIMKFCSSSTVQINGHQLY